MLYFEVIINEEGMWVGEVPKIGSDEVSIKELKNNVGGLSEMELHKLLHLFDQTKQTKKGEVVKGEIRNRSKGNHPKEGVGGDR